MTLATHRTSTASRWSPRSCSWRSCWVGLAGSAWRHRVQRTGEQRVRESSLTLDEGVLYAQSFVLATTGPTRANPVPAVVHLGGAVSDKCPNAATLARHERHQLRATSTSSANSTWMTKVRDNGGALGATTTRCRPTWPRRRRARHVRRRRAPTTSTATTRSGSRRSPIVRGKARNVVARLQLEKLAESIPQTGVTAGALVDDQQRQPRRHADHRHRRLERPRALQHHGREPAASTPKAGQIVPAPAGGATRRRTS